MMEIMKVNISEPVLLNMVVCAKYRKTFRLDNKSSNSEFFYEREIFPAALISRWSPAHVALFHNGSLLCTGIKEWSKYEQIINDFDAYLHAR